MAEHQDHGRTSSGEGPDGEARAGEPSPASNQTGGHELASGAFRDALGGLVSVLMTRGRVELSRAASTGRVRLDLRMLRRDQDRMYQKLGREVRALVEGGEVTHPGLRRGVERILEHEERIRQVEQGLPTVPVEEDDEESDPAEAGTEAGGDRR